VPSLKKLGDRLSSRFRGRRGVDIIIPIFGARKATRACVESVLANASGDWRLYLIDDASPDPKMRPMLRDLAGQHPQVSVHHVPENQGFVATANIGMQRATQENRDSLLLNSDTLVPTAFNHRMADTVYADPQTGIATPFTNNGTICSIPKFMEENSLPPGFTSESFDQLVREASDNARPELVTAVGFCMYIRCATIREVGFFDEANFGTGYGEENDFCERAKAAQWKIRLCDNLFVFHAGSASFGESAVQQRENHNQKIGQMHPNYHRDVQSFIRTNPLAPLHEKILHRIHAFQASGQS
jgi:GT2 family glycosyltransferase